MLTRLARRLKKVFSTMASVSTSGPWNAGRAPFTSGDIRWALREHTDFVYCLLVVLFIYLFWII